MRQPRLPTDRLPVWAVALLLFASGCSPALDWREVRPDGGVLTAWLPCKPERRVRDVVLAGATVPLELLACSADGSTWGVASAPWRDAGTVGAALEALRAGRRQALDGTESEQRPVALAGVAPHAGAGRFTVQGRRPDGSALTERAVVFAHGGRVFHAAALGGAPSPLALETFFDNLAPRR